MTTGIIVLAVLFVLPIAIALFFWGNKYQQLYSPQNLLSLAEGLEKLKPKANSKMIVSEQIPDELIDELTFLTPQGTAVFYTVHQVDDGYSHHISISHRGGPIAHRAGEYLAVFITKLMKLPAEPKVPSTTTGIQHIIFTLDPEQQEWFLEAPLAVPDKAAVEELWKQSVGKVSSSERRS